jgi:hypothetical protein
MFISIAIVFAWSMPDEEIVELKERLRSKHNNNGK